MRIVVSDQVHLSEFRSSDKSALIEHLDLIARSDQCRLIGSLLVTGGNGIDATGKKQGAADHRQETPSSNAIQ